MGSAYVEVPEAVFKEEVKERGASRRRTKKNVETKTRMDGQTVA